MHELGIAKDLFKIIQREITKKSLTKVTKITINLGEASGVKKEFLKHSFYNHILQKTKAENAVIEIKTGKVKLKCNDCKKEFTPNNIGINLFCPSCKSSDFEIIAGKDIYIENIEGRIE